MKAKLNIRKIRPRVWWWNKFKRNRRVIF